MLTGLGLNLDAARAAVGAGHRAEELGGSLAAGPEPTGGGRVVARYPLEAR